MLDVVDVPFDSLGAQLIFTLGVSLILFYGGLNLSLPILRRSGSALGDARACRACCSRRPSWASRRTSRSTSRGPWRSWWAPSWRPTDPAILIPLFVRSRLKPKVAQTVIAESAFNDPTGAALALTLAGVVLTGESTRSPARRASSSWTSASAP